MIRAVSRRRRTAPAARQIAVEIRDLVKVHGDGPARAVDGVSLRLEAGEVLGLAGPNRAGKSTIARIIVGLCHPTSGHVERLGRPLSDRSTLARVGYVHEKPSFPAHRGARSILGLHGALAGVPASRLPSRIDELLSLTGLDDRRDEPAERFSKGMAQRLAMALALVGEPELLVLDEPGEGLDAQGKLLLHDLLRDHRRRGGSALLISHQPAELQAACERVALISAGRILGTESASADLVGLLSGLSAGAVRP